MRGRGITIMTLGFVLAGLPEKLWSSGISSTPPVASCAADPQLPAFEVAAITPVAARDRGRVDFGQYGLPSFHLHGVSLQLLLSFSFDVQAENFLNAPRGLEDAVFDVDVKAEEGTLLSYEALKPRMQQMLQQRFCLKVTPGTKETAGYVLVLAKNGTRLKPVNAPAERGSAFLTRNEVNGTNIEMSAFARMLTSPAGKPVQDQTGLRGKYTLKVQFASVSDEASALPSLFTAVREQLGLELKPGTVPVPTLRIDRLNLSPTDN